MLPLPELRRFLLGLIGPRANPDTAKRLRAKDWRRLNAIAAQHRLQPHLHARLERGELEIEVPADLRQAWQTAHRNNALRALTQRKALLDVTAILGKRGIRPIALKGAWCAWHGYPAPAERPMRDIDLLLPGDRAIEAFNCLTEAGFRQERPSARLLEDSLHHDKHLPPLVSNEGVRLELHMRLWEKADVIGWRMPPGEEAAYIARAIASDGDLSTLFLAAEDMLAHFTIHAALSNRLNGGPLGLIDIAYLIKRAELVWPHIWKRAEAEGWSRALALVLYLTDAWRLPGILEASACPVSIGSEVLQSAPDLLLQDLSETKAIGLLASLRQAGRQEGIRGIARQIARRGKGGDRLRFLDGRDVAKRKGLWVAERLASSVRMALRRDTQRVAKGSDAIGAWLEGGPEA